MHLIKLFTAARFTTARRGSNLSVHQHRMDEDAVHTHGGASAVGERSRASCNSADGSAERRTQGSSQRQTPCGSLTSESESHSVVSALCNPMDYTVHEILQARILEWVVFPFSKEFYQPRDQTQVSCNAGGFFTS